MHATLRASWAQTLLTEHAQRRMSQRGIGLDAVAATLLHGRCVHARGACLYVLGRREVARARRDGLELGALDGIHVVCGADGAVLTVFRNRALMTRDSCHRPAQAGPRRRPRPA